MLEEISADQTDRLSPPVTPRARRVVETLPRGAGAPLPRPTSSPPTSAHDSPHPQEAPESVADSPLKSLSPSLQYLNPMTPASPRSEAGYEDTIRLAFLAGANLVIGKPARAGSALAKNSRAFAARSDNKPQSYTEAMADSTKWRAAI